jgi:REP element-mobilizing transposase RayT
MARKTRIEFPGAFYHVLARGNNKQKIFKDNQDYKVYITRLSRYHERYKCILYAYALMPNHIHLLLETGTIPLSKIMQGLQQSYTSYFHKKYISVGHVFQARYKAILCQREAYLLELVRYIHLNPVRAALVEEPEDYLWSSHHVYIGYISQPFVEKSFIFSVLSDKESVAERIYKQFIRDGMDKGHQKSFYNVIDQRFLGNSEFVERARRMIKNKDLNGNLNTKQVINVHRDLVHFKKKTLSEILKAVTEITGVPPDSIISSSRERRISHIRSLFVFLAVRHAGISNRYIAEFLGRDISNITRMIQKIEVIINSDPALFDSLDRIMQVMQA